MSDQLNRTSYPAQYYPERIIQFGEGNFLRAFVDWIVQQMNKSINFNTGIVVVQPRKKNTIKILNEQDGLYTVRLTGIHEGTPVTTQEIITCVNRGVHPYEDFDSFLEIVHNPEIRFVVSNTTEAGIVFEPNDNYNDKPPSSFPGKLTRFLHERYKYFNGSPESGVILFPCELLDRNGDALKTIVLQLIDHWKLPGEFKTWIEQHCVFCNSLVDRIVPGFPAEHIDEVTDAIGYKDKLVVEGEQFHLWVIEADDLVEMAFPAPKAGVNVIYARDLESYRKRKVRILNGAHTAMVPIGLLCGLSTVDECIQDPVIGRFLYNLINKDVLPTLQGQEDELSQYASDILQRFRNPALKHKLSSIALNSIAKFNARLLPTIVDYYQSQGILPQRIVCAFAALLRFYRGDIGDETLPLSDDVSTISRIQEYWATVQKDLSGIENMTLQILADKSLWNQDLSMLPGLTVMLSKNLRRLYGPLPGTELIHLIEELEES